MPTRRRIMVTGASSGIGCAISTCLLAQGHCVIGIGRNFDKAAPSGSNFEAVQCDLGDLDALPARLQEIAQEIPAPDALVCCAGIGRFGSLEEFSYGQIRQLIDVNLISHIYVARTFIPMMKRQGSSDLIFIGSEAALVGGPRGAVYCASKFGLRGLAQSLRKECANSGLRVCIINPGMVKTAFYADQTFAHGEDRENYILPEDVAAVVAQVLSLRQETLVDEINMSPLKKVIRNKQPSKRD